MKILIIEDQPTIVEIVALAIQIRWPEATVITTQLGAKGIELIEAEVPDIVILDLGLPDIDGLEVLKQVRLFSEVPIIILTVRDEEQDIVKGLEWGADEYIVKPFRQLELIARINALLRKKNVPTGEASLVYGPLRLDLPRSRLFTDRKEINLTNTESLILYHLMKYAEKVVTLSELTEILWGVDFPKAADAIRVYIRRLRIKIEIDPSKPQFLHTRTGQGYTLKILG